MPFYEIKLIEVGEFVNCSEVSSGVQIGKMWGHKDAPEEQFDMVFVFGGRVAFEFRSSPERDLSDYLASDWLQRHIPTDDRAKVFDAWLKQKAQRGGQVFAPFTQICRSLTPLPSPATMPAASPLVYGHVSYLTTTQADDVFYHFEPFPAPSRRIYQDKSGAWQIAAGTFANPKSELPLMVSGFAVTAQNALPGLLPACFRYELQPVPNQPIRVGAGVPLFGHSGGGVEIEFGARTANRGPMANPIFLDPL